MAPARSNAMSPPVRPSCLRHRPAEHLEKRASRESGDLSCSCTDDQRSLLSIGRRAHSYIPHSECFPVARESPAACCCLDSEIRICLRLDSMPPPAQPACLLVAVPELFGRAHLLSRQAIQCLLPSRMWLLRAFPKFAPRKLSVGEWYRDGTGVGFCNATTEVVRDHPFEVLSTFLRRINEGDLVTTESSRGA